jgi:hypothetical protein
MKLPIVIDFERAGGFAGLNLHTTINSHSLPAGEKEELDRLLDEAGIPELMQKPSLPENTPDQFIYSLKIQRGKEQIFIQLAEKEIPPYVRPLLKFLTKRSRLKNENHNSK